MEARVIPCRELKGSERRSEITTSIETTASGGLDIQYLYLAEPAGRTLTVKLRIEHRD
jgi:hypothetical protein